MIKKYLIYPAEAIALSLLLLIFWLPGLAVGSWLGGMFGRFIGPLFGITGIARQQIRLAFPDWADDKVDPTVRDMWENVGRTLAEYPHLYKFKRKFQSNEIPIEGKEILENMRDKNKQAIFFSAHLGNWELSLLLGQRYDLDLISIYRAPNNPWVDWILKKCRQEVVGDLLTKGPQGARGVVQAAKTGRNIALLIDQKMNDGIPVPFFGRDAMTAPAIAQVALKNNLWLVPVHVVRERGVEFRIVVEKPFKLKNTKNKKADIHAAMVRLNKYIEGWVTQHPSQWFWLHKRWPKKTAEKK